SRRRHTRSTRDWSSDVCSSDLLFAIGHKVHMGTRHEIRATSARVNVDDDVGQREQHRRYEMSQHLRRRAQRVSRKTAIEILAVKIGRASCRERAKTEVREGATH